jgi:hypothetical protein
MKICVLQRIWRMAQQMIKFFSSKFVVNSRMYTSQFGAKTCVSQETIFIEIESVVIMFIHYKLRNDHHTQPQSTLCGHNKQQQKTLTNPHHYS